MSLDSQYLGIFSVMDLPRDLYVRACRCVCGPVMTESLIHSQVLAMFKDQTHNRTPRAATGSVSLSSLSFSVRFNNVSLALRISVSFFYSLVRGLGLHWDAPPSANDENTVRKYASNPQQTRAQGHGRGPRQRRSPAQSQFRSLSLCLRNRGPSVSTNR
ncbi:hypothetical protein B0H12DRAFT_1102885 [Mycena haematopus]|nr:hypothetical protein B0H12DRAFT_1102885 [Mycena haematopus]